MSSTRYALLGDYDEATRSFPIVASSPDPVEGEALETWDLTRFEKNPVIVLAHLKVPEAFAQLPLGKAEEIKQGPEGLSMRVVLAPPEGNPLAGHVAHLIRGKFLRGVSVGFEPGEARKEIDADGKTIDVRSANKLLEVSLVAVPKDENAGTSALHSDAKDVRPGEVFHTDAAMSKVQWTDWGTARIPTRIARVGVLDYPGRREYKPESELFREDAMSSLKGVPVFDISDHSELYSAENFGQKKVLGFVEDVYRDGEFLAGTLHIHDGDMIECIRRGERLDVSAGYVAPTAKSDGTWRGEPYTHVQRNLKFNHVALCPPGRGRAGAEVALKLDVHVEIKLDAQSRPIRNEGARTIRAR